MNIYSITVDGQTEIWAGADMTEACRAAEGDYIREVQEDENPQQSIEEARRYFQTDLLESCTLIGECKNWPRSRQPIEIVEAERPE